MRIRSRFFWRSIILKALLSVLLSIGVIIATSCGSPAASTATAASTTDTRAPTTATVAATAPSGAVASTATGNVGRLYPVSVDGKLGFIDKTGTIRVEPRFVAVRDFSEGLAAVQVVAAGGTKYGYIDGSGTMVIEPQYDRAYDFSEGLAVVGNKTGHDGELSAQFGYIDKTGRLVLPIEHYAVSSFEDGLAWFTLMEEGYPTYFMDKTGATVLGPYHFVLGFSEGLAYAEKNDKCGYIDKNGRWLIELPRNLGRGSHATGLFFDGLAGVQTSDKQGRPIDGFIDTAGDLVIPAKFSGAFDFSEGLAAVSVSKNGVETWGYIDKTGAWAIEPQYSMVRDFSGGLAAVTRAENGFGAWGYIDKTGTMVVSPRECLEAGPFVDGIAALKGLGADSNPDSLSYIDRKGELIWLGR